MSRRWQRSHLIAKYGAACYLCGHPIPALDAITIDHWVPLSRGGLDEISNYRLAHFSCNQVKADLTPDEFRAFQNGEIEYS
nr:HNH endonuclease signature motif containing protein [Dietzia maris]